MKLLIDEKKLQKRIGFVPHKGQEEVLKCRNKEKIIVAGRGWGKSAVCGYEIVRNFLNSLMEIKLKKRDTSKIWVVAPTYDLTEKVFQYVAKFLINYHKDQFAPLITGGQNRPYQLKVNENIWIACKTTSEPQGMLGERVDLEVVDEAALVPERVYYQNIKPSIAADGKVIYIGTPRGKNWFHKKFIALKEKGAAFHFKSADGVHYDEEDLEELKREYPELLYRQEYEAEFVDEAGTVFRDVESIIGDTLKEAQSGHKYIIGVDLAESQDYTVMTVVDTETHEVVHIDRFKGRDYPLQKKQIIAKAVRYNNARVIIDASGVGRPVYEDLHREGIWVEDFTFTGKSKEELIGKLIVFVENKYIKIPKFEPLIDELKAFEYQYLNEKTGLPLKNIKYSAPAGYHDDCVMSLALAVWQIPFERPHQVNMLKQKIKEKARIKRLQHFI